MMQRLNVMVPVICTVAVLLAAQAGSAQAVKPRDLLPQKGLPGARILPSGPASLSDAQSSTDKMHGLGCTSLYCLQQATLNGAGQPAATATTSYALNASLGQELVTGCSSSYHYVLQSGFWGWAGSTLVPVVLFVTKAPAEPAWPRLDWTGNNAPYSVYRTTACALIFDGYYAGTSEKTYVDETPPAADLTCYNILATAPGRSGEGSSPEMNGSVLAAGPGF